MPCATRCSALPIPDSSNSCGEFTAPPHKMISLAARAVQVSPLLAEDDAGRPPPVKGDFLGQCIGDDAQIGPGHRRPQIADRGRAALAVTRRRLVIADAVLLFAIKIVVAREAQRHRGIDKGFADRMMVGDIGDAERPAGAVISVGAARLMLGALEIGQHVIERPAGIAELAPMVEILGLPADIDHAVDRGRAAQAPCRAARTPCGRRRPDRARSRSTN